MSEHSHTLAFRWKVCILRPQHNLSPLRSPVVRWSFTIPDWRGISVPLFWICVAFAHGHSKRGDVQTRSRPTTNNTTQTTKFEPSTMFESTTSTDLFPTRQVN
eukprot:1979205-Amphidinium_carterae.1